MAKSWTEDEQILALNLYHLLPFGRLHKGAKEIIALASIMERSPSSVAMKLCNFASLDPVIYESGRKGLQGASQADRALWAWHVEYPEKLRIKSQALLEIISEDDVPSSDDIKSQSIILKTEKTTLVKTRIGQSIFRKMVLDNYDSKCCFSGVDIPQLLVASHIVPWAEREDIRLNPRNGLCLSSLHDRTFDQGFWTLNEQAEIVISDALKSTESNFLQEQFKAYEGKTLVSAKSHMPEQEFFRFHREHIFKH
jgi:putative restriction endonuclease